MSPSDRARSATRGKALLQSIYDWFTEAFDTPDMKEAEALLYEVAAV